MTMNIVYHQKCDAVMKKKGIYLFCTKCSYKIKESDLDYKRWELERD